MHRATLTSRTRASGAVEVAGAVSVLELDAKPVDRGKVPGRGTVRRAMGHREAVHQRKAHRENVRLVTALRLATGHRARVVAASGRQNRLSGVRRSKQLHGSSSHVENADRRRPFLALAINRRRSVRGTMLRVPPVATSLQRLPPQALIALWSTDRLQKCRRPTGPHVAPIRIARSMRRRDASRPPTVRSRQLRMLVALQTTSRRSCAGQCARRRSRPTSKATSMTPLGRNSD